MTISGSTPSTASFAEQACMCSSPMNLSSSLLAPFASEIGGPVDVCVPIASEKLCDSGDFQRMRLIRSGAFGTQARARKYFAGIRKPLRIEGAAHQLHGLQVGLGKHFGHHHLLLFA